MTAPWTARLEELAVAHGLPDGAVERLAAVLELLRDDPTAPTTVTEPASAVAVHVADSLAGLEVAELRAATRMADVGAGAGFPGIPLALALPAAQVFLVESLARKCAFLERAVEAGRVANASVVCARIEEWSERSLDAVVVRAVAPLSVLVEYAAPVLREGGALVAWKGRRDADEEAAGAAAARVLGMEAGPVRELAPSPGADHRALHVYRKVGPTPARFPRRPGMARKRPLTG